MVDLLEQIQSAIIENRYRVTDHALEELEADSLHVVDLVSAILTGLIERVQPAEPDTPGPRYTVVGKATDLETQIAVVCRFVVEKRLLVITVYAISHD